MKRVLDGLCAGVLIAGVILFVMGLYYMMIRAGIPYQDPPLELQIQYAVNMGIGEELVKVGLPVAAVGIAAVIIRAAVTKKKG